MGKYSFTNICVARCSKSRNTPTGGDCNNYLVLVGLFLWGIGNGEKILGGGIDWCTILGVVEGVLSTELVVNHTVCRRIHW